MQPLSFALFLCLIVAFGSAQRLAGECAMLCNDLRTEVLTLEMCREAKRTLPKPKVGDFCSVAMEQGFSDVCVPLCMDQKPNVRVAQACRAAAVEMPRPTVRRWCEHGYTKAYEKTIKDLQNHFVGMSAETSAAAMNHPKGGKITNIATAQTDPHFRDRRQATPVQEAPEPLKDVTANYHSKFEKVKAKLEAVAPEPVVADAELAATEAVAADTRAVLASIPITIDDMTKDLVVRQGQNAEEAVVMFCRENVAADVPGCIRQLLSVVLEKMEEVVAEKESAAAAASKAEADVAPLADTDTVPDAAAEEAVAGEAN